MGKGKACLGYRASALDDQAWTATAAVAVLHSHLWLTGSKFCFVEILFKTLCIKLQRRCVSYCQLAYEVLVTLIISLWLTRCSTMSV